MMTTNIWQNAAEAIRMKIAFIRSLEAASRCDDNKSGHGYTTKRKL